VREVQVTAKLSLVAGVSASFGSAISIHVRAVERRGCYVGLLRAASWHAASGRAHINLSGLPTSAIGRDAGESEFPNQALSYGERFRGATKSSWSVLSNGSARLKPGVRFRGAGGCTNNATKVRQPASIQTSICCRSYYIVGDVRPALVALLIAVTLVLLIAAVNVAKPHVCGQRRVRRRFPFARHSASRGRIHQRVLTESCCWPSRVRARDTQSLFGAFSLLVRFAPEELLRLDQIRIDGIVLL